MSIKTDLYTKWNAIACDAMADSLRMSKLNDNYRPLIRKARAYGQACRVLQADDGLDHVAPELRKLMKKSGSNHYADMLNELDQARETQSKGGDDK
ncbi:hypothetical protein [Haloglycomyces albus]|uniref:hypothetical protein n=1 Tax=Haloglycomyces albus TaxID=526067 RepID=UPI00046CEDCE|nr:hypothetical protein [Haloglycomyces albus]